MCKGVTSVRKHEICVGLGREGGHEGAVGGVNTGTK